VRPHLVGPEDCLINCVLSLTIDSLPVVLSHVDNCVMCDYSDTVSMLYKTRSILCEAYLWSMHVFFFYTLIMQ